MTSAASTASAGPATPVIDELTTSARIRPGDDAYPITRMGLEALLRRLVVPAEASNEALVEQPAAGSAEDRGVARDAEAAPAQAAACNVNQALVDALIAEIDRKLSDQVDAILHHPSYQRLESAWRSLKFLVDRTNFRENIRIQFLSLSKQRLMDDFADAPEVVRSGLYKLVYTAEYGQFGGQPYGAIVADYEFGPTAPDIGLLREVAKVAAMAHAPFLAAASSQFFGIDSMQQLPALKDLASLFEGPQFTSWNSLRENEDSRYLGLALPRFLLRLPYGRPRSFVCQYDESDLDFLHRWMQREGLFYLFEHHHDREHSLCEGREAAAQASTRFAAQLQPRDMPDLYSDGPPAQVRTLQYVLRVFFEPELEHLQSYELLPVARLLHDGDAVCLDDDYIAPCLGVGASPALRRLLADLRDELGAQLRRLEELKGMGSGQAGNPDETLRLMLALRTLARAVCWLSRTCESHGERPLRIHARLRELVAELSTLSRRCDAFGACPELPQGLSAFDPLRLRECFGDVRDCLQQLLRDLAVGPAHILPLRPCNGGLQTPVPPQAFDPQLVHFLLLRADAPAQQWASRVPREARLAAPGQLPALISHALGGLPLRRLDSVPAGVPAHPGGTHWIIDRHGPPWDAVRRESALRLHWPDAPDGLQATLIVVEGRP